MSHHLQPDLSTLKQPAKKSKSGRIAELLPEIEDALAYGVRHKDILSLLNASGLDLNMVTYANLLYRARNQARKKQEVD